MSGGSACDALLAVDAGGLQGQSGWLSARSAALGDLVRALDRETARLPTVWRGTAASSFTATVRLDGASFVAWARGAESASALLSDHLATVSALQPQARRVRQTWEVAAREALPTGRNPAVQQDAQQRADAAAVQLERLAAEYADSARRCAAGLDALSDATLGLAVGSPTLGAGQLAVLGTLGAAALFGGRRFGPSNPDWSSIATHAAKHYGEDPVSAERVARETVANAESVVVRPRDGTAVFFRRNPDVGDTLVIVNANGGGTVFEPRGGTRRWLEKQMLKGDTFDDLVGTRAVEVEGGIQRARGTADTDPARGDGE